MPKGILDIEADTEVRKKLIWLIHNPKGILNWDRPFLQRVGKQIRCCTVAEANDINRIYESCQHYQKKQQQLDKERSV